MNKKRGELTSGEKIRKVFIESLSAKIKIEEITVMYICERAGVSKSTFYRNYKDIYDIFEQLIGEFLERCETLVLKLFFEKSITINDVVISVVKNGLKRDNDYFYIRDVKLIEYSIEEGNAKVIDLLYDKTYSCIVRIAKQIGTDEEDAHFSAVFFLYGNIIPIFFNLYENKKLDMKTVMLTAELFEWEAEKWKKKKLITAE